MPIPNTTNCLRYWDLSDHIQIDDAIALWCGVEPSELKTLNFETQCISAKRAALMTALRDGRLEYEDLGVVSGQGRVFKGAPVDELVSKGRLAINKPSLRRWFEQLPFADRPTFLFDEDRQAVMPDGSEAAEMNSLKGIAIMAMILARGAGKYRSGEKPNAEAIGYAVQDEAQRFFGSNVRGFKSFNKKVGEALRIFMREFPEGRKR